MNSEAKNPYGYGGFEQPSMTDGDYSDGQFDAINNDDDDYMK